MYNGDAKQIRNTKDQHHEQKKVYHKTRRRRKRGVGHTGRVGVPPAMKEDFKPSIRAGETPALPRHDAAKVWARLTLMLDKLVVRSPSANRTPFSITAQNAFQTVILSCTL